MRQPRRPDFLLSPVDSLQEEMAEPPLTMLKAAAPVQVTVKALLHDYEAAPASVEAKLRQNGTRATGHPTAPMAAARGL